MKRTEKYGVVLVATGIVVSVVYWRYDAVPLGDQQSPQRQTDDVATDVPAGRAELDLGPEPTARRLDSPGRADREPGARGVAIPPEWPTAPVRTGGPADAIRYLPLLPPPAPEKVAAMAGAQGPGRAHPPKPTRPEAPVLSGDRPAQLRQYVAVQQAIERATVRLALLPADDPGRTKLEAFVAETQALLTKADELLKATKPSPAELANARAELEHVTAQPKPLPAPGDDNG